MKKNKALLFIPLTFLHIFAFVVSNNKHIIKEDVRRWAELTKCTFCNIYMQLVYLLVNYKEFRNIYYLRIGKVGCFLSFLFPPLSTLYIWTKSEDFGSGTFIQHGFSTVITARKIGRNCWINQQVTIGWNDSSTLGLGNPIIGDNVRIGCGAKICGPVSIGNNSVIGMNAVIVKNVEKDSTVIPSPSMLIKELGNKTYKKL